MRKIYYINIFDLDKLRIPDNPVPRLHDVDTFNLIKFANTRTLRRHIIIVT